MPVALLTEEDLERIMERVARRVLSEGRGADVLSTAQAAELARRSEETVREWCASGALIAKKRGKVWAIRREDLDRYLAGNGEPGRTARAILASLGRRRRV